MKTAIASMATLFLSTPAFAQGVWYYCESTHSYYPYVSTCAAPWQEISPTPPGSIDRQQFPTLRRSSTIKPGGPVAPPPSPAPNSDQDVKALLKREDYLNDKCRGVSGDDQKTQAFCVARDEAVSKLEANGWCWGPPEAFEYQKSWRKCLAPAEAQPASPQLQPAQQAAAASVKQPASIDLGDNAVFLPSSVNEEAFRASHPEFQCSTIDGDNWCSRTGSTYDDCLGLECSQITYVFSGGVTSRVVLNPSALSWRRVFDATRKRLGPPRYDSVNTFGMHTDIYSWNAASPSIEMTSATGSDVYGRPIAAPYSLLICMTKCGDKVNN